MLKPILFNTEMVDAILAGRKTATRRIVKPNTSWGLELLGGQDTRLTSDDVELICDPPCAVGDVLWVRETWSLIPCIECCVAETDCERDKPDVLETADASTEGCFIYRANGEVPGYDVDRICWSPSIHMPKQAARIFLRVTEVFPKRLQESINATKLPIRELSQEGIKIGNECEECLETYGSPCCIDDESECGTLDDPREEFAELWDSTIRKDRLAAEGWAADPWVWVIRFERVSRLAAMEADPSLCVE